MKSGRGVCKSEETGNCFLKLVKTLRGLKMLTSGIVIIVEVVRLPENVDES